MTDNEIMKVLECCTNGHPCYKCELLGDDECAFTINRIALDLINRQKSKVQALKMDIEQLQNDIINANCNCDHIAMLFEEEKAENQSLKKVAETQQSLAMERHFEIERLKAEIEKYRNFINQKLGGAVDLISVYDIEVAKAEAIKEFAGRMKGKWCVDSITCCENIDELVEEMVGDV